MVIHVLEKHISESPAESSAPESDVPTLNESPIIVIDPEICAGKPVIRGTRIPVEYVVRMVRRGYSHDTISDEFDLSVDLVTKVLEAVHKTSIIQFA